MSEIIVARDIDIVTAEIITIRQQAQKMMLAAVVEIGKRLCEAKELLPHGEWGRWLEKSVSYSQSTANNMMALYREYGEKEQVNLFNDANSQLLEKLSYTQALALMAVPEEERVEFLAENKVEAMSTRELQQAIRERDAAKRSAEEAEENLQSYEKVVQETKEKTAELQKMVDATRVEKAKAEAEAANLQAQLNKAKMDAQKARDQLRISRENPVVSDDVMAKLREEAEEAAAKRSAEEADKKLGDLRRKLDEANAVADSATKKQAEIEAQLVAAQKAVKMAAPEIAVFKSMFEALQDGINKINGYRLKTAQGNAAAAQNMGKALQALFAKALEDLK